MRLRNDVHASSAIELLRSVAMEVGNIMGGGGDAVTDMVPRYVSWLDQAEVRLREMFVTEDVVHQLMTERSWRIRALTPDDVRPLGIVDNEIRLQRTTLEAAADALADLVESHATDDGVPALVLDTNVFMHFRPIDQIEWPQVSRSRRARVVVPLSVIDELDALGYHRDPKRRERARQALKLIDLKVGHRRGRPADLRDRTELQVAFQRRITPGENSDGAIIDAALSVKATRGDARTMLVTGDVGMKLRATQLGLDHLFLDGDLRRSLTDVA